MHCTCFACAFPPGGQHASLRCVYSCPFVSFVVLKIKEINKFPARPPRFNKAIRGLELTINVLVFFNHRLLEFLRFFLFRLLNPCNPRNPWCRINNQHFSFLTTDSSDFSDFFFSDYLIRVIRVIRGVELIINVSFFFNHRLLRFLGFSFQIT